jgi:NO-binding membrane sensor protein with MHYT domain
MAHVHHFAYGWFSPALAFSLAFLGSMLGLGCTARAGGAATPGRRRRWLVLAAISLGGGGIWLMHFMAMLGFDVPDSPVRYHPGLTALSMLIAVGTVGAGLFVASERSSAEKPRRLASVAEGSDAVGVTVGSGRPSMARLLAGGLLTGTGVAAMHYTGMAALRVAGRISYDPNLVAASVAIAVVAATVALWFAVSVRHGGQTAAAALVMAGAITGMHYTGMAAVRVELGDSASDVAGVSPLLLIIPITLLTAGALLAVSFTALQALTEEELAARPAEPRLPTAARG